MTKTPDHEVTRLLHEWAGGNEAVLSPLMELVYPEMRRLAAHHLRSERSGHTLQPTELVHEAYLRLAHQPEKVWNDRTHFFAVAARIVRHILVDHARARLTTKRGSGSLTIALADSAAQVAPPEVDLLDLESALRHLEQLNQQQSRVVELRYFGGLSIEETAEVLRISVSSVKRDWIVAKTWIRRQMLGEGSGDGK
jgi:RNA polymerase sigma factor (TIGR02999 family)